MKISYVKAIIKEDEILELIKEYVKVEGLEINNIIINEFITIEGSYKFKVNFPFKANVAIGSINDSLLNLSIMNVKIGKIGVLNSIKNFAMKKIIKDFEEYGITSEKEIFSVDLTKVLTLVPFVNFKIKEVKPVEGSLEVELEDLAYIKDKETAKIQTEDKVIEFIPQEDCYTEIREEISKKVPNKYEKIVEYAMIIPDIVALLWRLLKDKRVNTLTKAKVAGTISYLALPFDILPDFIPLIGRIDDIAIAFYGLNSILNDIPEEVILQNWQGEKDIIMTVKEGVKYVSALVGSENVKKLVDTIKDLGKSKKEY